MKTEVRNEFILEAHKSACNEWKLKIEKECPKLFKSKLEVGKWYKDTYKGREKNIVFITEIDKEKNTYGYGFIYEEFTNTEEKNKNGKCLYNNIASDFLIPATEEEVKEALIKEVKKRWFKNGVYFKHNKEIFQTLNKKTHKITTNEFIYYFQENKLVRGGLEIFNNGKWATISNPIEEKIKEIEANIEKVVTESKKQINELKKQL